MADKVMTGKERAGYRAKANSLTPLFQIGKGGVSAELIKQTDDALKARELIKLKVLLESSPVTPREVANELSEKTNSHVIQVIGGVIVLYRFSPELVQKAKEKEKNKKVAASKARAKAKDKEKVYMSDRDKKRVSYKKKASFGNK